MNCKELRVKIKDDGIPYSFENAKLRLMDKMLVVDSDTSRYCFPIENVLYYRFEIES